MSVQINNGKVPEEFNGLDPMITELLQFTDTDRVVAVVTYKVTKKTQNIETGDDYPVVRAIHIEPITGPARDVVLEQQRLAKEARTGTTSLDIDEPERSFGEQVADVFLPPVADAVGAAWGAADAEEFDTGHPFDDVEGDDDEEAGE